MRPGPARQVSFADVELAAQSLPLDPLVAAIATFLDTHAEFVGLVHQDLVRGLSQAGTGRTGLSAVQTLRAFTLQRIKNWDLRELRARIADGLTLRRFTTFDGQAVPSHTAFHRAFTRLAPATVRAFNDAVVRAAITLGLDDGTRLRVDTTVVETDIHYPTDSTLLWDGVRVLTRLVGQLGALLPAATQGFVNHTRRARRRMQEISRLTPAQRPRQQRRTYRDLLAVTTEILTQARAAASAARTAPLADPLAAATVQSLRAEIDRVGRLADRVIAQTQRRVLQGEAVPAAEKLLSIFEPPTGLIVRGTARTPAEFGHKIFLAESAGASSRTTRSSPAIPPMRRTSARPWSATRACSGLCPRCTRGTAASTPRAMRRRSPRPACARSVSRNAGATRPLRARRTRRRGRSSGGSGSAPGSRAASPSSSAGAA